MTNETNTTTTVWSLGKVDGNVRTFKYFEKLAQSEWSHKVRVTPQKKKLIKK